MELEKKEEIRLSMGEDILNDSKEEAVGSVERALEECMLCVVFSIHRTEVTYFAWDVWHAESVQPLPGW